MLPAQILKESSSLQTYWFICVSEQMQQQAQKDMATGALNEQTVNAYFQQHMQKVRAPCLLLVALLLR